MEIKEITFATDLMQFQNPGFLWALSLLAIPIAIHLFNLRRYKTVYFSDIRFLKDVQKSSKRQKRLKEWLVLLSRCLAIIALVIAFAKPFIPVSEQSNLRDRVILVLDNSASTSTLLNKVSYFEINRKKALQLLDELPADAKAALMTAGSAHRVPKFTSVEAVRRGIEELQVVDRPLDLHPTADFKNTTLLVFSDFQKNEFRFFNDLDTSTSVTFFPADEVVSESNVSIDSTWTEAPFLIAGQTIDLFVKINNRSTEAQEVTFEVNTNGLPEITRSIPIQVGGDTILQTTLTQLQSGYNQAQLHIVNDVVQFDNRKTISFYLPLSNRIIEIFEDQPNPLIQKIFDGSEFNFQAISKNQMRETDFEQADLIILNELTTYSSGLLAGLVSAAQDANLLIIPPKSDVVATNALLNRLGLGTYGRLDTNRMRTSRINTNDPFFTDVFSGTLENAYWPTIKQHYKISRSASTPTFNLLTMVNGDALFVRSSKNVTNVFQLAVSLDPAFSDITSHPVIVPLFIKSLMKKGNIGNLTGIVGENKSFNIPHTSDSESPVALRMGDFNFIPKQRSTTNSVSLMVGEEIDRQGTYSILQGEENIGQLNFNLSNRESDLSRFNEAELHEQMEQYGYLDLHILSTSTDSFVSSFKDWQLGIQYWRHFLLVALIFVLVEVILLRFLK